jgi:hypothetical protein
MRKPERHALGKAEAEAGRIAMPALALEGDSKSWLAAPWKRSHNAIKKTLKGQHDSLDAEPLSHVSKKNQFEKEQRHDRGAQPFERDHINQHRSHKDPCIALLTPEV